MKKIVTTEAEIRKIVREEMIIEQGIGISGDPEANAAFDAMADEYYGSSPEDIAVVDDIVSEGPMRWEEAARIARDICNSEYQGLGLSIASETLDMETDDMDGGEPGPVHTWTVDLRDETGEYVGSLSFPDHYPEGHHVSWDGERLFEVSQVLETESQDVGETSQISDGQKMILYHGTCEPNAKSLLKNGWSPYSGRMGGNRGNPAYLYVSTGPEDAEWFAEEKGCGVVLAVNVPMSVLGVDPEDGMEPTVKRELANAEEMGFPAKLTVRRPIPAEAFSVERGMSPLGEDDF